MPRISALSPMTSPADADELPVNDVSVTTTKKLTLVKLKEWLQSLVGWIATAMLADNSVTPPKTALFANMPTIASVGSTALGTSYTDLTSTSVVIPSGCNFVLAIAVVRLANGAATLGDLNARIFYDSTTAYGEVTITNAANFHGGMATLIYPVPVTPNTTKNFKIQGKRTTTGAANGFVISAIYLPLG